MLGDAVDRVNLHRAFAVRSLLAYRGEASPRRRPVNRYAVRLPSLGRRRNRCQEAVYDVFRSTYRCGTGRPSNCMASSACRMSSLYCVSLPFSSVYSFT